MPTVKKYIRFAAPYKSQTFNDKDGLITGRSGVLSGGLVTTTGNSPNKVVTIQPLAFIQNGLIVRAESSLSTGLSDNLVAPYFVAVSTSSSIEDNQVITPTFIKSPLDMSADAVLVAEWDGQEWRQLPFLSVAGILEQANDAAVAEAFVGISSGLVSSAEGSSPHFDSITVGEGAARLVDGSLVIKKELTELTISALDPNGFERVDSVVFRKPLDSDVRIGTIEYVVGGIYNPAGGPTLGTPALVDSVKPTSNASKVLNLPANDSLAFLWINSDGNLKFSHSANSPLTPTGNTTLNGVSTITGFDAVVNQDGNIEIVYTSGHNVYYKRIGPTGTVLQIETAIALTSNNVINPKVVTVRSGASFFLHIVFQRAGVGSVTTICYVRLSSSNTIETEFKTLLDLSAQLDNPSLAKDDDDSTLYLALQNTTTGDAYLYTYDASTATGSAVPTQIGTRVNLAADLYDISRSAAYTPATAVKPVVIRTPTKATYVFWLSPNSGGANVAVAFYSTNFYSAFNGHASGLLDLYQTNDNLTAFDVAMDGMLNAHFSVVESTGVVGAVNLRLNTSESLSVINAKIQLNATLGHSVKTIFTSLGALVHSFATTTPAMKVVKSTAALPMTFRDRPVTESDIYLSHYRTSDGVLAVAGTAIEEDIAIRRLYEFNNLFAKTGTVTWGGTANHLLTIQAPMTISFLDRLSTYTIPVNTPSGTVVPDGSVCYVVVPDEDVTAALDLVVAPFGSGVLDRNGRKTVPLFWSIDGVLYTKFAPFRVDAGGDTIVIGESLSADAQLWLGLPGLNPDPSNHNYSSATIILNTDNYNAALGKLDAAINDLKNATQSGLASIGNAQTTLTVTLARAFADTNYAVFGSFGNSVDTAPQFQPYTLTQKTTTDFTIKWNAPTDSANYTFTYIAQAASGQPVANVAAITNNTASLTVTIPNQGGTVYKLFTSIENHTDSSPQFQTPVITDKQATQFTVKWNANADSANYILNWLILP